MNLFAIISSIVWRISNIVSQAKVVEHQINGILISLKNKKELIEKEYQLPINTIYQDSLTSKLIKREFEIKSKNSKLSVIDKLYVNGGLFFKKAVCRDSRQGVGYKVTE